jgi:transposase-like protein
MDVLFLTYDIVRRVQAHSNQIEHNFNSTTNSVGTIGVGGVERDSVKIFLVPVPDRTPDTFMAVISDCIEPGITVVSDSWAAYRHLDAHGYTHQTVNHTIGFLMSVLGLIRTLSKALVSYQGYP